MDPKDRAARRDRLRARAVTTTVVATVVAAPVLALWAAYRGTPVGEGQDGRSASALEVDDPLGLDGEMAGGGYENTGNASTRPGPRFGKNGKADVSVEVIGVPGAGRESALDVTADNTGDTTLITLAATGAAPVRWSASTGAHWLYLSQSSGTLRPGESLTIKVYVDHLREPSGPWQAQVAVAPVGAVVHIEGFGTAPTPSDPGPGPDPRPSDPPPTEPDPTPTTSAPDPDPTPTTPPPSPDPDPTPTDPGPSDPTDSTPPPPEGDDPSPSTS